MAESSIFGKGIKQLTIALEDSYFAHRRIHHISSRLMPSRDDIYSITESLFALVYPGFFGRQDVTTKNIHNHILSELDYLGERLYRQVYQCYSCRNNNNDDDDRALQARALRVVYRFFESLPKVRELLELDMIAAFKGDPAAQDTDEVIFSYPATIAITTYRMAHELWYLNIPLLPRIMTEHAHSLTGIDIHPGAKIGRGFFIDHGTGVVIGETTSIGDNCKLYQGVTLGAVSFPHDTDGMIIRGHKRHPTLEDEVIVYANATILGNVTIGRGATIGGSVFLTRSVPPGSMVSTKPEELRFRNRCSVFGRGKVSDYQI
ncbi:MAG: hypothetical protein JW860_13980 [Sedimentisphaerales bacterium]|nr:hypothetical protein [Sedimentisphaerales bacterium]